MKPLRRPLRFLLILVSLALLAGVYGADLLFARGAQGGADLLLPWGGLRGFLFEELNPYETQVSERVAELTGLPARRLDIPFPLAMLYLVFAPIPAAEFVRAAGILVLQISGLLLALFSMALAGWKPPRWLHVLFLIANLFWLPAVFGWAQGAPVAVIAVLMSGALLAMRAGLDDLAGALLALTIGRPALALPFIVCLLLLAWKQKRPRILYGFFMLSIVLIGIATLVFPGWLLEFGRAAISNLRAFPPWTLGLALEAWLPGLGGGIAIALSVVLLVLLVAEWGGVRKGGERRWLWAVCLTLAATPLLGMPVTPASFGILTFPFGLLFGIMSERWPRSAPWLVPVLILALLAGTWWLAVRSPLELEFLFVLPVAAIIGLYWLRWWALRPPRTWMDRVSAGQF